MTPREDHYTYPSPRIKSAGQPLNARRLSAIARRMYTNGPFLLCKLQHWRPYICPFENLVGHVGDGSRVLDVACCAGLLLSLLAGLGPEFEGIGFDVSRQAIDLAKSMAKGATATSPKVRLSFERLDINAAWPLGTFDVVFLIDVLHHVPPTAKRSFLKRVISKVKPGGLLVYKDMCIDPWWKAQANRLHDLVISRELISYVPVRTVEDWANSEGMQVVLREDMGRFWYGHELRVMKRSA